MYVLEQSIKYTDFSKIVYSDFMHIPKLDWKGLLKNQIKWEKNVARRACANADFKSLLHKYEQYKELSQRCRKLLQNRNLLASNHGGGPSEEGKQVRLQVREIEKQLRLIAEQLSVMVTHLPNDTHPDTPEVDTCIQGFNLRKDNATIVHDDHVDAMEKKGWMVPGEGVRIAGRGFSVLRGQAALLEYALCYYAINFAIQRGFTLVTVPDLVKEDIVEAAGFAPRKAEEDPVFRTFDGLVLAATAELPLLAMHCDSRYPEKELPKLYVACGHAFRREAGQYGANVRGLYRQHQFTKVELFALSSPERSDELFETICAIQLDLIKSLGFRGRQLEMSAPELGSSAYRKRDIELWFPGSNRYGEVTSASHCTDYQARRCNIRMEDGRFAHTLNATAIAVPRIIQCIVENGMEIPKVLEKVGLFSNDVMLKAN